MGAYHLLAFIAIVLCLAGERVDAQQQPLVLGCTLRDQAPDYMIHANYPSNYWTCDFPDNPTLGTAGTANGGKGWPGTDFELPEWAYGYPHLSTATACKCYVGEAGMMGNECNATNNWVNCGALGSDNTPAYQYPGMSPGGSIQSPQSFYTWFHDGPTTVSYPYNLTLTPIGGRVYQYSNQHFFPLDGRGWQDSNLGSDGAYHNFGFCLSIQGHFSFQGGEIFQFDGDDDLWVYLDRKLIIDLGGAHPAQTASVNLNDIAGLVPGTNYRFDMFYCERHTIESHLQITTSIEIACTYYDQCDICEGDGQSCCTADDIKLCNDGNACTQDKCAVLVPPTVGCQHVPLVCNDNNQCTIDTCNNSTGCVFTAKICNDNSVCTVDSCSNATGCNFVPITCLGDACNTPICVAATGCSTTPVNCNDNNVCTTDSCDTTKGCSNVPVPCNDNDACTTDSCDPVKGCSHIAIVCTDNNACTVDSCSQTSGCTYTAIACNDNNACTNDACDTKVGCTHTNVTCNDGNVCTVDGCNTVSGCTTTPLPCDDGDACTTDTCTNPGGCQHAATTCNDNNACTVDSCDHSSGCVFAPKDCDDQNPCTADSCSTTAGCQNTAQSCNHCAVGQTFITCAPVGGNLCFPVECDPNSGACNITRPVNCNDTNLCTTDTCSGGTCSFAAISCDDSDGCTIDSCAPATGCAHTAKNCDDSNPCTTDTCTAGSCVNTPVAGNCIACGSGAPCTWTDPCNPKTCDQTSGTCIVTPYVCNDGNLCTTDTCATVAGAASCQTAPVVCTQNDFCNPTTCNTNTGTCDPVPVNCSDGNACTQDLCVTNSVGYTCTNPAISCAGFVTSDLCTPPTCDSKIGCTNGKTTCDDGNVCTVDSCATGTCVSTLGKVCDDSNACTDDICDSGKATLDAACSHPPTQCANTVCANATGCNTTTGCTFTPFVCPTPADFCLVGICDDTVGCVNIPKTCVVNDPDCYVGVCNSDTRQCSQTERADWTTITTQKGGGVTCFAFYNQAATGGIIAGGVIAGIVVAAVVFAALAAVAARKAYLYLQLRAGNMGAAQGNPLYSPSAAGGENPMYRS